MSDTTPSPTLRQVRKRLAQSRERIESELESLIRELGPTHVLVHVLSHPATDCLPLRVEVQMKVSFKL